MPQVSAIVVRLSKAGGPAVRPGKARAVRPGVWASLLRPISLKDIHWAHAVQIDPRRLCAVEQLFSKQCS